MKLYKTSVYSRFGRKHAADVIREAGLSDAFPWGDGDIAVTSHMAHHLVIVGIGPLGGDGLVEHYIDCRVTDGGSITMLPTSTEESAASDLIRSMAMKEPDEHAVAVGDSIPEGMADEVFGAGVRMYHARIENHVDMAHLYGMKAVKKMAKAAHDEQQRPSPSCDREHLRPA